MVRAGRAVWLIIGGLLAAVPAAADGLAAKLCASCHGAQGRPMDSDVPIIWGQHAAYLEKQLRDYRAGDRDSQIMSSIAESLTDDQIHALAASYAAQPWTGGGPADAGKLPAAAQPCEACHQADFRGGEVPGVGMAPRLAGQQATYLRETMHAYATRERANSPVMPGLMKALPAVDRDAIAAALGDASPP